MTQENDFNNSAGGKSSRSKWIVYLVSLAGLIYLLNPTAGIFELLPDNLPIIGNLDEGAAAVAFWQGIQALRNNLKKK